jgi:hypothetical protein
LHGIPTETPAKPENALLNDRRKSGETLLAFKKFLMGRTDARLKRLSNIDRNDRFRSRTSLHFGARSDGRDLIFPARQNGSVLALDVDVSINSLALLGGLAVRAKQNASYPRPKLRLGIGSSFVWSALGVWCI